MKSFLRQVLGVAAGAIATLAVLAAVLTCMIFAAKGFDAGRVAACGAWSFIALTVIASVLVGWERLCGTDL